MSHYSDAEDSLADIPDFDLVLRKRKIWDPESESITSEIKELLDEDVNSLVSFLHFIPLNKLINSHYCKYSNKI